MTQDYYTLVTNNGLIKHTDASINQVNLDLTQLAVGDSNGTYYNPDGTELALQNELYRTDLTHLAIDQNNLNQLILEAVIDETVGSFYIREVGIYDSDGDLFAIGKYPETFKPNLPSGSGKRLYIRMILGFVNAPNVNLIISDDINNNPNFSTDVNNALIERLIKTNNLSDLSNIQTARDNLNLKNGAVTDFTGAVMPFAISTPPNGWLECNGSPISRTVYANLFSKIGTTYGGDNSTFNIPDLRGEFIRGWDNNRGVDNERTFGSFQTDAGRNITGSLEYVFNASANGVFRYNQTRGNGVPCARGNRGNVTIDASRVWGVLHTANEFRPKNIALMYCIKY